MPQRNLDRDKLLLRYPDERWVATCSRDEAILLRRADHHVVWIAGRPALLLTYSWDAIPLTDWPDHLACEVSFTYAKGHPRAPDDAQRIVDTLAFSPAAVRPTG